MFWKTICEHIETVFGFLSPFLGVFLGWFLNEYTRRGKLTIFIRDAITGDFYDTDKDFIASSIDESDEFRYKVKLEISNSSLDTKIMKDIQIVFYDEENKEVKLDADITREKESLIAMDSSGKIVNFPAKMAVTLTLSGMRKKNDSSAREEKECKEDLQTIYHSKKIFLLYKDEKNKEKKKLIFNGKAFEDYKFWS